MALSLASPGIKIAEVDLTKGGITNTTSITAGIAGAFERGPVNEAITIFNENELLSVFGKPSKNDYHYETWYSAINYLSYGGNLKVVRCSGSNLKNANAGVGLGTTSLKIENYTDYQENYSTATNFYWAAKNPGYWGESIKVCVIDNFADQTISGVNTTSALVGYGVTQALSGTIAGVGTTTVASGYLKGIITGIGASTLYVRVTSKVVGGTESVQEYTENGTYSFGSEDSLIVVNNSGSNISTSSSVSAVDWYNTQNILDVTKGDYTTLPWRNVAPRPRTNAYSSERNGGNDSLNIVVIDSQRSGNVSGTAQGLLENFSNLSKASDAKVSPTQNIYYKDYLAQNSRYIYAGVSIGNTSDSYWGTNPVSVKFTSGFTAQNVTAGAWGSIADNTTFNSIGNVSYELTGAKDYSGTNNVGGFAIDLENICNAYDKLSDETQFGLNFILQGNTALTKEEEQAKANKLIAIAESRKDCIAFISPHRSAIVNVSSPTDQLQNVLSFFSPIVSTSYAVFDSGYQYIYDRFNQQFVYIPCSADVAGLCARTDIDSYPWYSPAGKSRGSLKSTIKLAYNPNQNARDQLYSQRINPIISSPGSGIILFGDKTALSYQSAFDRINVRRLFIAIEQSIKSAADFQLFEFNDSTTRANFINIVEPFLRDVQVKRGITDFLIVCDESNNTPDVIDRNEFLADIYVKPARSINFIGLTFVATRTGVSFESIVGRV